MGLEGRADEPGLARALQGRVGRVPQAEDLPERAQRGPRAPLRPAREGRAPAREEDAGLGAGARERLPDVLRQVAEHGRHCPREVLREPAEHRLAAAAARAAPGCDVEAVLGGVQVEGRELLHELGEHPRGPAEGVGAVGLFHLCEGLLGLVYDVPVQERELGVGDAVGRGVKVAYVAQHEADSVADLADVLGHRGHDALADGNVEGEVHGGHPHAEDVCSESRILLLVGTTLNDGGGVNHVAN
mmetsp:Transcript_62213/g.192862  ORF Transcript_62213/g.192862 Transcript_62213/m.192862 type:complete len:244 (+) Transcript_62213:458-1189(+)